MHACIDHDAIICNRNSRSAYIDALVQESHNYIANALEPLLH